LDAPSTAAFKVKILPNPPLKEEGIKIYVPERQDEAREVVAEFIKSSLRPSL
jgi:hypothetical protein